MKAGVVGVLFCGNFHDTNSNVELAKSSSKATPASLIRMRGTVVSNPLSMRMCPSGVVMRNELMPDAPT
ncbi:MAG: hypothetical protein V9H26_06600 [Verrucomicrobiota bacterium]